MSKGITDADEYVFKLSDDLKSLAEQELRETAATRDFALKALRDWIESNPRIAAARLGKLIDYNDCSGLESLGTNKNIYQEICVFH